MDRRVERSRTRNPRKNVDGTLVIFKQTYKELTQWGNPLVGFKTPTGGDGGVLHTTAKTKCLCGSKLTIFNYFLNFAIPVCVFELFWN